MNERTITPGHSEWPSRLGHLTTIRPPSRLFVAGAKLEAGAAGVAIVGSRRPTAAGLEIATELSRGIAEAGLPVVSGLAMGIDAAAHRAALDVGGTTIAVLGCGLDVDYPQRNSRLRKRIDRGGTLVTEFEPGVLPRPAHFPARNRIIAAVSEAVVFVEGTDRSGGLITARYALDENRHVFAVPGSVRNPLAAGPNELIRTGQAGLATSVHHILESVAPGLVWGDAAESRSFGQPWANDTEAAVLLFLDDSPTPLDRLCRGLGLSFGEIAIALAALEVRNYVAKRPGGYTVTSAGARVRSSLPIDEEDAALSEESIPSVQT